MGRTGKTSSNTIKGQSDKDTPKDCVSEDTISKLMKDFTCASLLTKATQNAARVQRSSVKQAHASCCEEIVSSLKHFHLKTPVNKRTRLKEKKDLQRRAKSALENKFNLSIAAIHSQTSVVRPGKLHSRSSEGTDAISDAIIRPSRLSLSGITDEADNKPPCTSTSTLPSCIQTSSSQEKARIAACLNSRNISRFGDIKEASGSANLSFSQLCNKNCKASSNTCDFVSSTDALPVSIKSQTYRHRPTTSLATSKHIRGGNTLLDHNQSCKLAQFSRLPYDQSSEDQKIPHVTSSQHRQQQTPLPYSSYNCSLLAASSQSIQADDFNNNVVGSVDVPSSSTPTVNQSSLRKSASASSITPERSCSEEMRMEESNVNELASYFEDLLHIPRKMSVMAEMMYA